ncbi:MAG: FG-GAP-like repeat-containing protein [Parcubacteria group bacterium]|nr:FG-GAP-like repeat-containing protein [Parcubacteria group bacterium]
MLLNLYQKLKLKTEVLRGEIVEDKARGRFIRPLWKKLKRGLCLIAFDTVEVALIIFKKPGHMRPQEAGDGFIRFDSESFKGRYHYYTAHRSVRERARLFISTSFSSFVAFLLIFAIILSIAGRPTAYVEAATYNWLQTDWTSLTANTASHTSDQTGWAEYSATSTNITANTELSISNIVYAVTDDGTLSSDGAASGGGFGNGTFSNATTTGSGTSVGLATRQGDYDLIIGNGNYTYTLGYENTGTVSSPTWTAKTVWNAPSGFGGNPYWDPAFVDIDNDGDYDAAYGCVACGGIIFSENVGDAKTFLLIGKNAWNASYYNPAFADLDNDGDYDLLSGDRVYTGGGISYAYENTGTVSSPTWTAKTAWNAPDVGSRSSPAFADLDNDGDYDLLIGEASGISYAYENTGTVSSPTWTAKTAWNAPDVGDYAKPTFVDLDNDVYLSSGTFTSEIIDLGLPADFTTLTPGVTLPTGFESVVNPGFESGSGVDADNWTEQSTADRVSDRAHSGSYSMKFTTYTVARTAYANPAAVKQDSSATYTLSGWVYKDSSASVYLDLNDKAGECTASSPATLNEWQYVSCNFTVSGSFNTRIVVSNVTGNVWVDDISVKLATPPSGTDSIKFQLATNNDNVTWDYYGPDGTASTYYTTAVGQNIWSGQDGSQYLRYKTYFNTASASYTPTLDDITINYFQYTTSADLTSSAYDTIDPSNAVGSISWTEGGVSGSQDIKFQIRTAPDASGSPGTWTSWLGPTGTGDYYTDPAGGETINATHTDGSGDQWVQYKVFFTSTSDGSATPTLSDVTLQYVVNAPPDFDATFGNSGVSASQNAGAGLVTVQYKVRDIDTTSGTANAGFVTPSFEYSTDNGNNWTSIATSTYMTGDITNVAMNESTYTAYTAVWNAKAQINGTYTEQAKVRVTINDNEALNNTATQASAVFTLDVKNPVLGSVPASIKASSTPATVALDATDNSSLQYRVGLEQSGSDASWTSLSSTTTISLATDPDTTYTVFRDSFGNTTATTTSVTPETPISLAIQDTSNIATSDYRLFIAWKQATTPSPGFVKYNILRSIDNVTYSQVGSVSTISENYFTDQTVSYGGTYYYKVTTEDADGNVSYLSSSVYGTADGVQNGNEPGLAPVTITSGSVASSGATNDSVTISWATSVVATSTVYYSAGNTSYNLSQTVDTYSISPSVVLAGLSANTTYYYYVKSRDAQGETATDDNSGSGYTFTTLNGPAISNVSITDVSNNSATIAFSTNISAQTCVFYGTSKPPADSGNCTAGYGTTNQSVTQTGLSSGTRYYIYLRATPEDTGTYSTSYDYNVLSGVKEYYTFTTSSDSSSPDISSITVSVGDTTADIKWVTNEKATSQVEYGTASGVYGVISSKTTDLDINHTVSLSDIAVSTPYYFRVASVDSSGNSASSTENTFTTLEAQIGESERVTVVSISTSGSPRDRSNPDIDSVLSQVTEDGIIISWQTTEESDSFVEYGKSTNYESLGFGRRRDAVYSHRVVLPLINFEPGETYHFKVSSRDISGNLGESNDYTFSIKGDKRVALVEEALAKEADKGPISDSIKTFRTFLETYSQKIAIKSENNNSNTSEEEDIESFLKEVQDFVPPPILLSKEPDVETTANSAIVKWKTDVEANSIVDFVEADRFDENDPKFDFQAGNFDEYVTDHRVEIANLKTNTEYYMRIRSKNRLGAETKSDKFKVITTEEALEIIAHNTAVSETSIMVEWTTNNMADASVSYTPVKGGEKIISESKTKGDPNPALIHRIMLEDLDMNTLYDLEIKSRTDDGEIATFDLGRKKTGADEDPPVMSQIKVDQAVYPKLNKVQTIISWTTNEPAKSKVVYWEGVDEPAEPNVKEHDEFVTKHIVTLTNLKPGGVYRLKVESEDIAGQESISKPTAILTPKQSESVTQLIIKNVEDIFNFGKSR